jgi:hypothetical protein
VCCGLEMRALYVLMRLWYERARGMICNSNIDGDDAWCDVRLLYRESVFRSGHHHDKYCPDPINCAFEETPRAPQCPPVPRAAQSLRLIAPPDVLSCR